MPAPSPASVANPLAAAEAAERYRVTVRTTQPELPPCCVSCLTEPAPHVRTGSSRRPDGQIIRTPLTAWPYCERCHATLGPLDRMQRLWTVSAVAQMLVVPYLLAGLSHFYPLWWPAVGIEGVLLALFIYAGRRIRRLGALEWARVDAVEDDSRLVCSFRNPTYAARFAIANGVAPPPGTSPQLSNTGVAAP